jgi:GABA(A) receptor-associated protein
MEDFRNKPLEYRVKESQRLKCKYPDRVPVVIKSGNERTPSTQNFKYLVPKTSTVAEFVSVIRRMTQLKPYQAIFIFVDGVLPPNSSTMLSVYDEHHDEDGFLYITYSLENTFGN